MTMIISFKHNYIFIRPKKVAGSTIEDVLVNSIDPTDVIVKRERDVLPVRLKINGHGRPNTSEIEIHQHMTADEIYAVVNDEFWNSAFKFTAVRHPYERLVSLAHYRMAKEKEIADRGRNTATDMQDCIRRLLSRKALSEGSKYFLLDGKTLAVDAIVRQERLHEDLKRIGQHLNIPIPDELPKRKASVRTDRRPAHEILTQEQKDEAYAQCRLEFELLGYER